MNALTMIASYKGWEIVLDANSVLAIHHDNGAWICTYGSVRDAIVAEVEDMETRRELMRQWAEWVDKTGGHSC